MNYEITNELSANFVENMGSDLTVVNSARISFATDTQVLEKKDEKLIDYLAKNKHMSPFEHCVATFIIECPLYIRSQIHRHRTFAYNEVSRRYTSEDMSFYMPDSLRTQSKSNKQASDGEVSSHDNALLKDLHEQIIKSSFSVYEETLRLGGAKEMARAILPQNLMTKFYMTGNLRNWAHFIELRIDAHAQKEAQLIAKQLEDKFLELYPVSYGALKKYASER